MAMSSLFQQFLFLSLSTTLLSLSPTLSAIHTLEKHRHRLIRRSRLLLHVLRFIGSTSSALNKRSPQNALPWSLRRVCSSCASCTNRSDTLRTFPLWSFLSAIQRKNTLLTSFRTSSLIISSAVIDASFLLSSSPNSQSPSNCRFFSRLKRMSRKCCR